MGSAIGPALRLEVSCRIPGKEVTLMFLVREEGQGLVEYALILVLVAIVVIAILLILGPVVGNVFSNVVRNL
jgi:pilus assembly protein Flp/PilA